MQFILPKVLFLGLMLSREAGSAAPRLPGTLGPRLFCIGDSSRVAVRCRPVQYDPGPTHLLLIVRTAAPAATRVIVNAGARCESSHRNYGVGVPAVASRATPRCGIAGRPCRP